MSDFSLEDKEKIATLLKLGCLLPVFLFAQLAVCIALGYTFGAEAGWATAGLFAMMFYWTVRGQMKKDELI